MIKTYSKKLFSITGILLIVSAYSCKTAPEKTMVNVSPAIEVQGHRGDRGNFPENSIPAFLSAVQKGAQVLEMDLVISSDRKVVVSHEPYMAALFTLTPAGEPISKEMELTYNLYQMTYDSIRQFDVGTRGNTLFPNQQKMNAFKPLLEEVIDTVEAFIATNNLQPVWYNIELKSEASQYGITQPAPDEFIDLVINTLKEKGIESKTNLQSFDPHLLNVLRKKHPEMPVAYLVTTAGILQNLKLLNFKPEIYSPNFKLLVSREVVDSIKDLDMKLIPWTINEKRDIQRMIQLEVDGIITDYPERVLEEITATK